MPLVLDYGESQKILEITRETDIKAVLGYDLQDPKMFLIKEALKKASKIFVYRVNTGRYATGFCNKGKVTAQYTGERGNDLKVLIEGQVFKDNGEGQVFKIKVTTILEEELVDVQYVVCLEEIRNNKYICFDLLGEILQGEIYEIKLTGGQSIVPVIKDWERYFKIIRYYEWMVMALPVGGIKVKRKVVSLITELREIEGRQVYGVVSNYAEANSVGILSVANGIELSDGRILTPAQCTAFVAGSIATTTLKDGITLEMYEGAVKIDKRMSHAQLESYLEQGQIVFIRTGKKVVIAEDINTFKLFTPKRGENYKNNRFVRIIDVIKQDLHRLMKIYYTGSLRNGRNPQESKAYFKQACIKYFKLLQKRGLIVEFNAATDVDVYLSEGMKGVDISIQLKIERMAEKIYVGIPYNKMIS